MSNKLNGNINYRQSRGDDDNFNLRETLLKYSRYWPFFLVCVIIAMAGAYLYFKYTKPVYTVKATLVMQDSKDKPTEEKSALPELDVFNAPKVVENEMEILRSRQLVKEAVDHLQLWTSYIYRDGLDVRDLYGNSPINFKPADGTGPTTNQKLGVRILDSKSFLLTRGEDAGTKHNFGEIINDNAGSWSLTGTKYLDDYLGKTIQVVLSSPESTIQSYQSTLDVELKDKLASVVDITTMDKNARRGEDFINNLIYFYNQGEIAQKNNITKITLNFIDKRLDSLKGELNSAEGKVAGYRSGNGLTDINAQSQMYLQDVQSNTAKLNDVNIQMNVVTGLENYVNSPGNSDGNVPSTMGISDPGLGSLVQKLSDLQLKRTEMMSSLGPGNPAFEPINKQISDVKAAIKENLRNIKSNLLATKQQLQSYKSTAQTSIKSVPGQERELVGLNRQQTVKENLYTYLLQKREEISLRYASSLSDARLVDVAYTLPVNTTKRYVPFGIALLIGLLFPAGFIYGQDILKNNINKRRQIEVGTSIPVVAEFNYIKLPSELVSNNENSRLNFILIEQFRHLRTQLNFLNHPGDKGNVVLITSSLANEGKSFISSNLAISLAKSGKKTILLEMDIYKPKISKMFNLSGTKGLSDYLTGGSSKKEIIQKTASCPDLDIIGSGEYIDDFSELLDRPVFHDLLEELKNEYDHILIDTPPIHTINDAFIISMYCDVTLYVVRYNHTSKALLPFIRKLYTDEKLPKMNIVFNGLTKGRDGEGYKFKKYYYDRLPA